MRPRPVTRVRVVQTPSSLKFVGRATFEGITGAPVLVDEFEPDPARGSYPGRAAARPRADQPPRAGAALRRLLRRAGDRQHDRQAGRRPRRQSRQRRLSRPDEPVRDRRSGDEQPHVRARRPRRRTSRRWPSAARASSIPAPGALASRGEWGVGRLAEPVDAAGGDRGGRARRPAAARRQQHPDHRRRHARAARRGALPRQPLQRPDGLRARRRGGAARRRRDRDRRQHRAAAQRRASSTSTSRRRSSCATRRSSGCRVATRC